MILSASPVKTAGGKKKKMTERQLKSGKEQVLREKYLR